MKVQIVTDLEGISLVDSIDMMDRKSEGYRFACHRLMLDANAAIQGAIDAGADEIIVTDGHGGGGNFIEGELDPRATQYWDYEDKSLYKDCVACLHIGLHAKPGTLNGFLDHVQSSLAYTNYYVNGKKCGELVQNALFCGSCGVPVVMVSGDEAACAEAAETIEGIECAVVKRGIGRNRAECISSEEALERIRIAAYNGVKKAASIKPYTVEFPATIKLEFPRSDYCEKHLEYYSQYTRVDARTIVHTIDKIVTFLDLTLQQDPE